MIRPIDIRLNAAHPDLPFAEAVTYTGAPSTVLIRGVPGNCGRWAITAVFVAATFPDGSTSTRTAVQSANGVWVATLPATATSGRTAHGLRILADGADENGEAVSGYVLGVADFAVASLAVTPAPEPGETSWQMLYFDAVPGVLRKGDVTKVDGVLKLYNGTAWEAFANVPDPSTATPAMDGTGSAGSSAAYARGDHVHPTDTSRMAATATGSNIPASTGSALTIAQSLEANATAIGSIGNLAEQTAQGLSTHTGNTTIHVTATEKATWNGKQSALTAQQLANIAAVPSKANRAANPTAGNLAALDAQGNPTDSTISAANVATKASPAVDGHVAALNSEGGIIDGGKSPIDLSHYALTTNTIRSGMVFLDDHASNSVTIPSTLSPNTLTINFPTAPSGKVRDFAMRLNISAGVTAPEIAWPQGVTLENDGGEVPEIADGGTGGSSTILYFSETENNGTTAKFLVKGETLTAITQA